MTVTEFVEEIAESVCCGASSIRAFSAITIKDLSNYYLREIDPLQVRIDDLLSNNAKLEKQLFTALAKNDELRDACERLNGEIAKVEALSKNAYEAPTAEHHAKLLDVEKRIASMESEYRERLQKVKSEFEVSKESLCRDHLKHIQLFRDAIEKQTARIAELMKEAAEQESVGLELENANIAVEVLQAHLASSEAGRKAIRDDLLAAVGHLENVSNYRKNLLGLPLDAKSLVMNIRTWLASSGSRRRSYQAGPADVSMRNHVSRKVVEEPSEGADQSESVEQGYRLAIDLLIRIAKFWKGMNALRWTDGQGCVIEDTLKFLGEAAPQDPCPTKSQAGTFSRYTESNNPLFMTVLTDSEGGTGSANEIPVANGSGGWMWMTLAAMVTGGFQAIYREVDNAQSGTVAPESSKEPAR